MECVKLFKKGDQFQPKQFIETNADKLTRRSNNKINACQFTVSKGIKIGRELGLLKYVETKPISFIDFSNLESMQYFANQLRGGKYKNLGSKKHKDNTTRRHYLLQLHYFNNWLYGKTFEFTITRQIDVDVFKREKTKVTLQGIEHFLKLFQDSMNADSDFIRIIKMFLMDDMHKKCSAKYMVNKHCAILSYFEKNDSPIKFKYSPYNNHADYSEENENATVSLDDVHKIIVQGKASPLEKAVVLCKFHRGLDSSTFADRFNFQAWEQLVKWFGMTDYENWDLSKCPVPIRLSRVKTGYTHTGYLERDAIKSIQEYLNYRHDVYIKTNTRKGVDESSLRGKSDFIQNGNPMFVTRNNEMLSIDWVSRLVPRLARKAGIQETIAGNRLQDRSEKNGHELRDLLKSTLLVSDCADYVCDLVIGHKVGDSYEKQDKLYPEKSRREYSKASELINIFSRVSNYLNNGDETSRLRDELQRAREEMDDGIAVKIEEYHQKLLAEVNDRVVERNSESLKRAIASEREYVKSLENDPDKEFLKSEKFQKLKKLLYED